MEGEPLPCTWTFSPLVPGTARGRTDPLFLVLLHRLRGQAPASLTPHVPCPTSPRTSAPQWACPRAGPGCQRPWEAPRISVHHTDPPRAPLHPVPAFLGIVEHGEPRAQPNLTWVPVPLQYPHTDPSPWGRHEGSQVPGEAAGRGRAAVGARSPLTPRFVLSPVLCFQQVRLREPGLALRTPLVQVPLSRPSTTPQGVTRGSSPWGLGGTRRNLCHAGWRGCARLHRSRGMGSGCPGGCPAAAKCPEGQGARHGEGNLLEQGPLLPQSPRKQLCFRYVKGGNVEGG